MKKQIQIKLLPNGEVQMETLGIKGKKCTDYIQLLKEIANVEVKDVQYTDNYYDTDNMLTDENIINLNLENN